jgi:hypothetical protein
MTDKRKYQIKCYYLTTGKCVIVTVFLGGLEHLKIETRLIDEMFPSVMDEYDETIK